MDMRLTKMWLPWIILRIRLPLYVGRTLVANAALEMLKYSRIRGKYPSEMIVQCCCYSALAACTCNYLLAFPTKGHKGHFLSLSRHLCLWLFLLRKDEFFHANTVLAAIAWLPKSLFSGWVLGGFWNRATVQMLKLAEIRSVCFAPHLHPPWQDANVYKTLVATCSSTE